MDYATFIQYVPQGSYDCIVLQEDDRASKRVTLNSTS